LRHHRGDIRRGYGEKKILFVQALLGAMALALLA